jgi:TolB-like protein/Tfp pilus assembly protein PilF
MKSRIQFSFFAELQRRHVYKVGAMYAVAGWLIVQVITQVFPIYEISMHVQRIFVGVVIALFPVAVVLAWLFDVTPAGIVRTEALPVQGETQAAQQERRDTGRKLNYVLAAMLLLALGYFVAERTVLKVTDTGASQISASNEKSIAVLPFENLSDEKSNAYFAAGIQDEILTRLAKVGALKVISRISTAHYASSPGNLPEIAKQLGVANILEGSVQKVGDAVHINVQLIRAATDDHLWAESYDRKLDNIFGVEGDVAGAIAQQLNAKLSGTEQQVLARQPTDNPAAYQAYLRARALQTEGLDYATQRKVLAELTEAVRLDPKFALAWANLANASGYLYFNGVDPERYTAEFVKQAADTALRLQPDLGEVQLAQGLYRYYVFRDFAGAQQALEAAVQRSPSDQSALQFLGLVERRQGKWNQALQHLEQASKLNPLDSGLMQAIGGDTLLVMGRYDEAREWLDRALALAPGNPLVIYSKVSSYQWQGRLEDAAHLLESMPETGVDPSIAEVRAYQRLLERRFTDLIAEVQPLLAQPSTSLDGVGPWLSVALGIAQRYTGQTEQSRKTFEKLITQLEASGGETVDDLDRPAYLALAYAYAGHQQAALAQARKAIDLYRGDAVGRPYAEEVLAQVQALGGDYAPAIAGIEQLLKEPAGIPVALLRLDPVWDPLRGDPRFQKLITAKSEAIKSPEATP